MNATYEVVASHSGDWWTVEVTSGLPANVVGVSQARRLTEVPTVARNLIGELLDIDPATIDVNLLVPCPPPLEVPELWGSCRGEITVTTDLTEPTGGEAAWISDWEAEWDEFLAEPPGAADNDTEPTG